MHYKINDKIDIKSENAAKSTKQTNKIVMKYISQLSNEYTVLDYGCGKLRYTIPLCNTVKTVFAVDSRNQITRNQIIDGRKTTITYLESKIPNLRVFDVSEKYWLMQNYDIVLCCNVLSAIPNHSDRIQVLKNIRSVLKSNGEALITVQYRNSYFKLYGERESAFPYYDGWIINNRGNYSFYGIITSKALEKLCYEAGLKIVDIRLNDGSIYFIVKR